MQTESSLLTEEEMTGVTSYIPLNNNERLFTWSKEFGRNYLYFSGVTKILMFLEYKVMLKWMKSRKPLETQINYKNKQLRKQQIQIYN